MSDLRIGDGFAVGLAAWLGAQIAGTAAAALPVVAAGDGVAEPVPGVMVAARGAERQPGMDYTARIRGVVVLRTSMDDTTPEDARAWAAAVEGLLRAAPVKDAAAMAGVFLHDFRLEDSAEGQDERERVRGWPVSAMVTLTEEV